MIWNSWVLSLIIGQIGIVIVNAFAFISALQILRRWDTSSYNPEQINLERKSELVATIVSWSLFFEILSLIVFERTNDSLVPFIPGAMCPIGVLGQNAFWGYSTLYIKIIGVFVYGLWIVIHHIDIDIEGFPLTLLKNIYTLILFPFLLIDISFQIVYFSKLDPNVITSCCGVVFEPGGGQSYASSVASLPPEITRWLVGLYFIGFITLSLALKLELKVWGRTLYSLFSAVGFFLGIAGVISFASPYIHQMPALHCPFCILKREYYYYGYLIYIPLFTASSLGIFPGLLNLLFGRYPHARKRIEASQINMIRASRISWIVFIITIFLPMVSYLFQTGGIDLFFGQGFQ